jgi:hypothetical protein
VRFATVTDFGVRATKWFAGELDHLARADQEQALVGDRREDPLGELHRRGGHRDRRAADVGLRAHVLRDREGPLEQAVQHQAERARRLGRAHRLLHLPEDLRLAEHHRVESRCNAECVGHRFGLRERVQVRPQRIGRQAMRLLEPPRDARGLAAAEIHLGAVARRQDRRLADRARAGHVAQRVGERVGRERDALAHVERRGGVAEADGMERHGDAGFAPLGGSGCAHSTAPPGIRRPGR